MVFAALSNSAIKKHFICIITWKHLIHHVNLKISKGTGLLAKLRQFVPKNTLRILYYAFIQPHIDHGLIDWGCANKIILDPIRSSFRKTVRVMAFEEKYDKVNKKYQSASPLFHIFNMSNFDDHCKLTTGKFMWEIDHNLHPDFIKCLFTKVSQKHKRKAKSASLNKYSLPFTKTNFKKQFIKFAGVKLWNDEIPEKIKTESTSCPTWHGSPH